MKIALILALLGGACYSYAQDTTPQVDESLEVKYVNLDIVVRDKKGRLITDLRPENFVIYDQGKKVAVETFRILDYRESQKQQMPSDEPLPIRQFVLAIDSEAMRLEEGINTFKELKAFIKKVDSDGLPYQVLVHSLDKHSRNAAFVNNAAEANAVLSELEASFKKETKTYRRPDWYDRQDMVLLDEKPVDYGDLSQANLANFSTLETQVNDLIEFEAAILACAEKWGGTSAGQRCIADTLDQFQGQQRDRSRRVFLELTKLAGQFEDVDGLKVLLFVSKGFINNFSLAAQEVAVAYGGAGVIAKRVLHHDFDFEDEFRNVVHACTQHRVVFHTFHAFNGGGEFGKFLKKRKHRAKLFRVYRGYDFEISEGLRNLAEASGGTFHRGPKWSENLMPVLTDQNYFYVLAYPQPDAKNNRFRKIKVKLKVKGKAYYRRGYYPR